MNFPLLDGDVPRSTSYDDYISQLIRFHECQVMSMTLILVIKFGQQNFSDKDINIINFVRRFQNLSAAF